MASTYLTRTNGTSTLQTKFTLSVWLKRSNLSEVNILGAGSGNDKCIIFFKSDGVFEFYQNASGSTNIQLRTNRKFRDTSAWYHLVVAYDSTETTSSDRLKLYVNGVQETSFSINTYPSSSLIPLVNKNSQSINVGFENGTSFYFDGSMSHINFIDGTIYTPSAFGEYDANGVWKIKTSPSVTYGNNGFFILKNGNSVTDQSGNSNNFTVAGGTLTNTEDNPSNVFATFNPLASKVIGTVGFTLENGNTVLNPSSGTNQFTTSTICTPSTGKFYWEMKSIQGGTTDWPDIGFMFTDSISTHMAATGDPQHNFSYASAIESNGTKWEFGTQTLNWFGGFSNGDIINCAVDAGAGKLWWGVNGSWLNSGDPANGTNAGATFTAGTSITAWVEQYNAGDVQANFGNGYFGTTAVASAGTNASGIGIFEYDVPTGFTALSTKGLNL